MTVQNLQANIRVGESLFLVRGDGAQLEVNGTTAAPSGTFYQTIEDEGAPLPQQPALNFINGDLANNPGNTSTDLTLHYQFWQNSDGDVPQRRSVHPNSVHFDVTDDLIGDTTRFALHSPIAPVVGITTFRASFHVDPTFIGTSTGSESNPYTTIAAAFAAAVAQAITDCVVWLAPGALCTENVVFPATGGNWEIASQSSWGFVGATISGTVTANSGAVFSRFSLRNLQVTGAITGDLSTATAARFLLTSVQVASTMTLTHSGAGNWRSYFDGGASSVSSEGGFNTGAVSIAGGIYTSSWAFASSVAWLTSPVFINTTFASATLTNTAGANTATFYTSTFSALNTTLTATAGSCVAAFDGPSMTSASNVGFIAGANVTTKTLNSNGSVRLTAANNVGLTQVYSSRIPLSLCVFEFTLTLLAAGTTGLLQMSAVYTDLIGVVRTVAVGPTLNITAAVGTEVSGSLIFSQNGNSPVDFRVDGVVTPGALSYSIGVAARQAS